MFKHGFPPEWSTFKKLIWLVGSGIAGAASGIWKTVTGTLLHLTDALASPVKELNIAIEPQQSGSGDPSPTNVRPITGWTGCNIFRSGADTSYPTTYPISWQTEAGTVYGGTLDVVNGTLTVTKATKTFDENDDWGITGSVFYVNRSLTDFLIGDNYHIPYFICNKYEFQKYVSASSNAKDDGVYTNAHNTYGKRIFVRDSNYSTVDAFKASLVNSPIVVCGELVNPITYTLTPQQISTLAGENNIWADVNGEITLTYKANA